MKKANKPYLLETMLLGSSLDNLSKFGSAQRELQYYDQINERFEVILFEYSKPISGENYKTIPNLSTNKWVNSVAAPLFHAYRIKGYGVVRSKQLWGSWSAWIFSKLRRKKFVLRCGYIWSRSVFHEHPTLHPIARWAILQLEMILVKSADALIYGSTDIENHYRNFNNKPSVVIPNGFDTDRFCTMPDVHKDYDFIYTGRLVPLKGIKCMLVMVGTRTLIVAGSGPLTTMVSEKSNVTYLGVVPNQNLPNVLCRAKFFISMSTTEGSPKCLIEAILCGLYPVLSDIPAHRLLVEELGYGLLLDNSQSLGDDLGKLIVNYEKLEIFKERYSMPSIVSKEVSFCEQFVQ